LGAVPLAVVLACWAAPAPAQEPPSSPECDALPEAHRLDFWIGTWDVYRPDGIKAGVNRIEPILGHCALLEHWTSERGGQGKSLNFFDPNLRRWRQLWVDASGSVIDFDRGDMVGDAMQFHGVTVGPDGATVRQRLTLRPLAADTVRQLWERSTDGGTSWQAVFEGLYVRRSGGPPGRWPPGQARSRSPGDR
jgi:hypothetical protein